MKKLLTILLLTLPFTTFADINQGVITDPEVLSNKWEHSKCSTFIPKFLKSIANKHYYRTTTFTAVPTRLTGITGFDEKTDKPRTEEAWRMDVIQIFKNGNHNILVPNVVCFEYNGKIVSGTSLIWDKAPNFYIKIK